MEKHCSNIVVCSFKIKDVIESDFKIAHRCRICINLVIPQHRNSTFKSTVYRARFIFRRKSLGTVGYCSCWAEAKFISTRIKRSQVEKEDPRNLRCKKWLVLETWSSQVFVWANNRKRKQSVTDIKIEMEAFPKSMNDWQGEERLRALVNWRWHVPLSFSTVKYAYACVINLV